MFHLILKIRNNKNNNMLKKVENISNSKRKCVIISKMQQPIKAIKHMIIRLN